MHKRSQVDARRSYLLCLFVLGLVTAVIVLPYQFSTAASEKGLRVRTTSDEPDLPNYDIRDDAQQKGNKVLDTLAGFRNASGKNAATVANVRDSFVRGEETLRSRIPTLKVEYNQDIQTPEVIGTDLWKGTSFLTGSTRPSGGKHADVLIDFLRDNNQLVGASRDQIDQLKVFADYTNPNGELSFVELDQEINGIPVFRGEVKAGFTKAGEMVRVINNFAPGLDYGSLSTDFGEPLNAVKTAAANVRWDKLDLTRNDAASSSIKVTYGTTDDATTAEKMYFPTEPGVARAAWRVLIYKDVAAYYVIVDAETGTILWRKNLVNDQTQPATYNVYGATGNGSLGLAMDSPAPGSPIPGTIDPTIATPFQAPLGVRTDVTLIGNEGALSFNNLGWMTDGTNGVNGTTDGNNVEAGLDIDGTDGVDPTGKADGTARVFSFAYNPSNVTAGAEGGDVPTGTAYRNGIVTNLFYLDNRYHDALYQVGFTELARNFQNDNFGRGGVAADRVRGEAQDSSGTNNANFLTPADGGRGRMQMYLFTNGTAPGRDGSLDSNVVWHEHTHGVSNRLIGNGSGLNTTRSGGSGEGWSDLVAFLLGGKTGDTTGGVYTTGGYATYKCCGLATFTGNYYYGIRRHPYAPIALTGGPSNRPYSPFTLIDVQTNTHGALGAFACSPLIGCAGSASEVHNEGEVWAATGVDVWSRIATRLGRSAGTLKTLQLYIDGMKLSPLNPTFIQSRDAVIAAAAAAGGTDTADVREGFRVRGMGFSATDNGTAVVEAFDFPNVRATNPIAVSDSTGDNDGFPEPGENVLVSIPVINPSTGGAISNVQVNINGGTNVSYGTINDGATVTMQVPYSVPLGAICGSLHAININVSSSVGAQAATPFSFRLGAPIGGAPTTFTNSAAITINDSTGGVPAASTPYGTTINVSGLTGNKIIRMKLNGLSHTFPGDIDMLLVGPAGQKFIPMSDVVGGTDAVNVTFSLIDTAANLLPSATGLTDGSEYRPSDITSGDTFPAPAPAGPYTSPAPVGTGTFNSVFGSAGSALNGTWTLYVVDDAGVDVGDIAGGWSLTFEANDYACSLVNVRSRADFDGDGRTDFSVFRPSEGAWYLQQTSAGFGAVQWGISSDTLTPGDFDGDGKTDFAVFRPNADPSQPDFYILKGGSFTLTGVSWGLPGDTPVVADYDGDGKSDIGVYRQSSNTYFVLLSGGGTIVKQYGVVGDVPVAGDFVGDNKADITVFRPSTNTWWIFNGSGDTVVTFGSAGDVLVPADYDGDNKDDIAIFRPATGQWIYLPSSGGAAVFVNWGSPGDIPVPGDFDGDGKDDPTIYRNGQWWTLRSTLGVAVANFGLTSDKPIPRAYLP